MFLPSRSSSARRESLWASGCFLLFFTGFLVAMETRFPHWTDREYAARRDMALQCHEENPERPMLAVIGGSRVGTGFFPEEMGPLHDKSGQQISVVNFSHLGAGPRMNLLQLHRLLREGITPTSIVVEIVPAHLCSEITTIADLSLADVSILRPHWNDKQLLINPAKARLKGLFRFRNGFLDTVAPDFSTSPPLHLSRYGGNPRWLESHPRATTDKADLIREIRWQFQERMLNWRIDPELDAAMRAILELCKERGIRASIALFPESSEFRSWYAPGVEERIQRYFTGLCDEYALPFYDCREWMDDGDFHDPHHMTPEGARRFSVKFGDIVLKNIASSP